MSCHVGVSLRLEVEPVPSELESLDPLSKQLIQCAKAFQAVFQL